MRDPSGSSTAFDAEPITLPVSVSPPPVSTASDVTVPDIPTPAKTIPRVPAASPQMADAQPLESHFWLIRADQFVLALLSLVMLALLSAYALRLSNWGTKPIEIDRLPERQYEFKIDVNTATWVEWGQLSGIGDALARRIVADRKENGPFESIDDLTRVKGIGPKTLERIRPWLKIEPVAADLQAPKRESP